MEITAERMAVLLNGGGQGCQVDQGNAYAIELDSRLRAMGWKDAKRYDECSKASFESYLEKDGSKIRIITACFFGVFTQIEAKGFTNPHQSSVRFMTED
jgi:hypothetical protein